MRSFARRLLALLIGAGLAECALAQPCVGPWARGTLSARWLQSMSYDALRDRVVLFGGNDTQNQYTRGDTWEWDGSAWREAAIEGPSRRYAVAMAYDSARGRTVLFGGFAADGGDIGDTWEWDGTRWTQVATSGPSPRTHSMMAFDAARGRTLLYGGSLIQNNGPIYGDTWAWDGSVWTQVATGGPGPRMRAAMAFHPGTGRVVLFGGDTDPAGLPERHVGLGRRRVVSGLDHRP